VVVGWVGPFVWRPVIGWQFVGFLIFSDYGGNSLQLAAIMEVAPRRCTGRSTARSVSPWARPWRLRSISCDKGDTSCGVGSALARILDVVPHDQQAIRTVCAPAAGVAGLFLGICLWQRWPFRGLLLLGLCVGVDFVLKGVTWVIVSQAVRGSAELPGGDRLEEPQALTPTN
jgi:hypothetical protein